jgi:hypothetical protein
MKIKRGTVQQCIYFQTGNEDHLLVKVRGRGWFIDTRGFGKNKARPFAPPTRKAALSCLGEFEGSFEPIKVKSYQF